MNGVAPLWADSQSADHFYGQPPVGFSGMQLPSEAGAFVTTTPGHGGWRNR